MNEKKGVGYKRPPEATRFKPGVSGNPSGRPKKPKTIAMELVDELDEIVSVDQSGRQVKITKARAIAKELVRLAIGGDLRAASTVISFCAHCQSDGNEEPDAPTAADLAVLNDFVEREIRRREVHCASKKDDKVDSKD